MPIDVARHETTAILTVNRPEAMNALDVEHMKAINDRLTELAADDAVKAIVDSILHDCGNGYVWHTTGSGKTLLPSRRQRF